MQHHHWQPGTVATLLPVDGVEGGHLQHPRLVDLQGSVENIIQSSGPCAHSSDLSLWLVKQWNKISSAMQLIFGQIL